MITLSFAGLVCESYVQITGGGRGNDISPKDPVIVPDLCLPFQINNMKTKFKETIEKCDSLEHKLNDLLKEKQSVERKWVPFISSLR
jgi:hypothetical protein